MIESIKSLSNLEVLLMVILIGHVLLNYINSRIIDKQKEEIKNLYRQIATIIKEYEQGTQR